MARLPACPDCGIDIVDKKQSKKISNRWVCFNCLEKREQIKTERQELYDLVAKLFFLKYPTGMMMKQIKDFKEDLEYTYKGMTLSLEYWTETLGNTMQNARGVGIIPFIYEDAKQFYIQKLELKKAVDQMDGAFSSDKEVVISKQSLSTKKQKKYKMINMDDL